VKKEHKHRGNGGGVSLKRMQVIMCPVAEPTEFFEEA
jgi:hypothetical protein